MQHHNTQEAAGPMTMAANSPSPAERLPHVLLPSLPTTILLYLSFFPVALGWLGWVALVPLLGLVRSAARPRRVYWSAYLVGLAFYLPVLQWMRVADFRMYFTWLFLAAYCALYFPLAIAVLRYLEGRTSLKLSLTLPVVWTALELFRSTFGTGFSWYLLGHTQHDFLEVIQIADITGAYGVSFIVVMVNAFFFEVLWGRAWFRGFWGLEQTPPRCGRIALLLQALVVLPLVAITVWYGGWRMRQANFTPGPRIALVQSNLPQSTRNDPGEARYVARHNIALCDLAGSVAPKPDLIVMPETSYPASWENADPELADDDLSPEWRQKRLDARAFTRDIAERWRTSVLLGLNSNIFEADGRMRQYNSALLIDPTGRATGRYDKIHRVPFGEYVPLVDLLPFMNVFAPYDFDYGVASGRRYERLFLPTPRRTYSFGVVICYEDTDPEVARNFGAGRAGTNFLLNISNDGWFKGTSEHEQHLAICRFRAIECRCPVGRSVNMGVSAAIDANGRVLQPESVELPVPSAGAAKMEDMVAELFGGIAPKLWTIPPEPAALPVSRWAEFKKVPGVLLATLPLDHRESFYALNGDWLPRVCWILMAAMLGAAWRTTPNK